MSILALRDPESELTSNLLCKIKIPNALKSGTFPVVTRSLNDETQWLKTVCNGLSRDNVTKSELRIQDRAGTVCYTVRSVTPTSQRAVQPLIPNFRAPCNDAAQYVIGQCQASERAQFLRQAASRPVTDPSIDLGFPVPWTKRPQEPSTATSHRTYPPPLVLLTSGCLFLWNEHRFPTTLRHFSFLGFRSFGPSATAFIIYPISAPRSRASWTLWLFWGQIRTRLRCNRISGLRAL